MSLKMKLVSMISAFVLVIGMLLIGVFAVERVQVDMGGSITFNADDVYARVTGSVVNAQVAPEGLDVTYSAYETTGNPTAWESLDLEFDSYATPIVISITVENLSTERSLTVNLTDALTSSVPNLGKSLQRDNGAYKSGTNITLYPKDNGTSTTTFTITLSVTDKNQSLTNAQFGYDLNLYDENYKFPEIYDYFTFSDNGDETVTLTGFNAGLADGKTDIVIPATVSQNADGQWIDGDDYTVVSIVDGYYDANHPLTGSTGAFARNTTITSVVLPDTIEYIGECAFYYSTSLASITLPEGLTSIGYRAFQSCSGLTSVDLSGCTSLASIGEMAFSGCSGLTSISLPSSLTSLTSIGYDAFYVCSGLESITVEEGNPVYHSEGNCLIETESNTLVLGCKNSVIPSYITSIGYDAFQDCSGLTTVDLSQCTSLTSIGWSAFYGCSGLTSISLPTSITSIEGNAFYGCRGLKEVIIDSEYVYTNAKSASACGSLFNNSSITTVKVLTSLDDGTNSYITTNFTKGPTEVIGGKSYTVYSKN